MSTNAEELRKYKELMDMGIISQGEFDAKKQQLLGQADSGMMSRQAPPQGGPVGGARPGMGGPQPGMGTQPGMGGTQAGVRPGVANQGPGYMNQPPVVNQPPVRQTPPQAGPQTTQFSAVEKRMNKHVFVWVGAFLFGGFGVDRFMRGQVGLGILKILAAAPTCGVWCLIDWIISLTKAYGNSFGNQEDVVFINGKYAR